MGKGDKERNKTLKPSLFAAFVGEPHAVLVHLNGYQ